MQLNRIYRGDSIEILNDEKLISEKSIDLIFADPPYNLQLEKELYRPNESRVNGVDDYWDKFETLENYDDFTYKWLKASQKVLKDTGSIWVIGSYHNIFRVGKIMQDLGFWILNDIIWVKTNPMPNFKGSRFTNAHESLIWAKKYKEQKKYTFNYQTMKMLNGNKQMRSDWHIPLCIGKERIKINGEKAHSTQKPEALLKRVIISSSNIGDIVLDPFFGTGTTGAVAKRLKRNWIGIEKDIKYIELAQERIDNIIPIDLDNDLFLTPSKRDLPRVPFGNLLEVLLIKPEEIIFSKNKEHKAIVCVDASIKLLNESNFRGSIHSVSAFIQNKKRYNGWDFWYIERNGKLILIDELRNEYRNLYLTKS